MVQPATFKWKCQWPTPIEWEWKKRKLHAVIVFSHRLIYLAHFLVECLLIFWCVYKKHSGSPQLSEYRILSIKLDIFDVCYCCSCSWWCCCRCISSLCDELLWICILMGSLCSSSFDNTFSYKNDVDFYSTHQIWLDVFMQLRNIFACMKVIVVCGALNIMWFNICLHYLSFSNPSKFPKNSVLVLCVCSMPCIVLKVYNIFLPQHYCVIFCWLILN